MSKGGPPDPEALIWLASAASWAALCAAAALGLKHRRMRGLARKQIAEARGSGKVALEGVIAPSEATLRTPLSGVPAVWYRTTIETAGEGRSASGKTLYVEERSVPFDLVDVSGAARVLPDGAQVVTARGPRRFAKERAEGATFVAFLRRYRPDANGMWDGISFTEDILAPGTTVYVRGAAQVEGPAQGESRGGPARVVVGATGDPNDPLLVRVGTAEQALASSARAARIALAVAALCLVVLGAILLRR